MVIDLKRCIGCYGCQIACKAEHFTPPGITWAKVVKSEQGAFPAVRRLSLPMLCMHCTDPACESVCPTGATVKEEDGTVTVDKDVCIGCRYCMVACPYGARYFNDRELYYYGELKTPYEEMGVRPPQGMKEEHCTGRVEKCDLCAGRRERELEPACVANCMCKARYFGDLDDPYSEVSRLIREKGGFQLSPELDTDPSVYYLPV
jgi:molybdopterin-containing oxidoreductase family iron-sulfur binding subunit